MIKGGQSCFINDFLTWAVDNDKAGFPSLSLLSLLSLLTQILDSDGYVQEQNLNTYLFEYVTTAGKNFQYSAEISFDSSKKLRLIQFLFTTNILPFSPQSIMQPFNTEWNKLISDSNAASPSSLSGGYQTGMFFTGFPETEDALVYSAIQGASIAFIFAFIVLLCSTLNWIISLYSLIGIVSVNACVLAIMELNGWEFGLAESSACVIIIGFSVDYVVHLGNHYVRSVYAGRHQRIKESLKEVGISIVGGAITTMGAGSLLYLPDLLMFNKYATIIVCTIGEDF